MQRLKKNAIAQGLPAPKRNSPKSTKPKQNTSAAKNPLWHQMTTATPVVQRQVQNDNSGYMANIRVTPELEYSDPYSRHYETTVRSPYAFNMLAPITMDELKKIARIMTRKKKQALQAKTTGFPGFIGVEEEVVKLLPHLNAALKEFDIRSLEEKSIYVAHMLRETSQLTHLEEKPNPEDSERYKNNENLRDQGGIGAFHHTDKTELKATARNLGFENENELINTDKGAEPELAFRMAGEYFTRHGFHKIAKELNDADANKKAAVFRKSTNKINPGESAGAKNNRFELYRKAFEVFSLEPNRSIRQIQRDRPPYSEVAHIWPRLVDQHLGKTGALYGNSAYSTPADKTFNPPSVGILPHSYGPF
ncbi:MAG: hypothetical protein GY770_13210 [Aestuariibacter sp.]|nr:hypothetical protein [Aestuariibacter sp.]